MRLTGHKNPRTTPASFIFKCWLIYFILFLCSLIYSKSTHKGVTWSSKDGTQTQQPPCIDSHIPGDSYRRRLGSLLCLCDVFRALIKSLVCWSSTSALGLVLFQIVFIYSFFFGMGLELSEIGRCCCIAPYQPSPAVLVVWCCSILSLARFVSVRVVLWTNVWYLWATVDLL